MSALLPKAAVAVTDRRVPKGQKLPAAAKARE
jgi:hypothetical protein